ncbi:hypothetical protein ACFE04_023284 [Oxalis oulophora]
MDMLGSSLKGVDVVVRILAWGETNNDNEEGTLGISLEILIKVETLSTDEENVVNPMREGSSLPIEEGSSEKLSWVENRDDKYTSSPFGIASIADKGKKPVAATPRPLSRFVSSFLLLPVHQTRINHHPNLVGHHHCPEDSPPPLHKPPPL